MSFTKQLVLAVVWTLSLVAAAEWRAIAQSVQSPAPAVAGTEVRFIKTGTRDGMPLGTLTTLIDGNWVPFAVQSNPQAVPLGIRR
jgi:hypothetical protein